MPKERTFVHKVNDDDMELAKEMAGGFVGVVSKFFENGQITQEEMVRRSSIVISACELLSGAAQDQLEASGVKLKGIYARHPNEGSLQ